MLKTNAVHFWRDVKEAITCFDERYQHISLDEVISELALQQSDNAEMNLRSEIRKLGNNSNTLKGIDHDEARMLFDFVKDPYSVTPGHLLALMKHARNDSLIGIDMDLMSFSSKDEYVEHLKKELKAQNPASLREKLYQNSNRRESALVEYLEQRFPEDILINDHHVYIDDLAICTETEIFDLRSIDEYFKQFSFRQLGIPAYVDSNFEDCHYEGFVSMLTFPEEEDDLPILKNILASCDLGSFIKEKAKEQWHKVYAGVEEDEVIQEQIDNSDFMLHTPKPYMDALMNPEEYAFMYFSRKGMNMTIVQENLTENIYVVRSNASLANRALFSQVDELMERIDGLVYKN